MRNRAFLKVVLLGLLTFAFMPGIAGAAPGMLASSAAERAVAVSGPIISVTPSSHDFGRVNVGSSSGNFDFTVSNVGDATLTISSLGHSGPGFSASAASLSIAPGGSTLLHSAYSPVSGSGSQGDNVTINSNSSNGPFVILLHGIANNAPFFDPPLSASYNIAAFVAFSLTASASDPEGDPVSYAIASSPSLPVGATFDGNTGTLNWTPTAADAGSYNVTVTASDGLDDTPGNFTINVTSANHPPVANAGGPYNGVVGVPIQFIGSASSDPDAGQSITFAWDFGDGATSTATNPTHAYSSQGTRLVTLTVTDNGSPALSNSITTTASAVNFIASQIITDGNDGHIKTNGQGAQSFGIEVFNRNVTDLDIASIKVSTTYPNAGTVSEVAISPKGVHVGDMDKDLIGDLDFQLRASAVKPLLIHVPNGTLVTLVITVKTISDAVTVRGTIDLIKSGSSNVSSATAGNPFKLDTKIQYTLRDSGPVQIRIYSVNGRLVRTLREEVATPGAYEVRWNGKDDNGVNAPSGIYFVSVKQGMESSQNRIVLAR